MYIIHHQIVVGRGINVGVTVVVKRLQRIRDELELKRVGGHILKHADGGEPVSEDIGLPIMVVVVENRPIVEIREKPGILRGILVTVLPTKKRQQAVPVLLETKKIRRPVEVEVEVSEMDSVEAARPRELQNTTVLHHGHGMVTLETEIEKRLLPRCEQERQGEKKSEKKP